MKKSYTALKAEIARLEKAAEAARKAEVAGVVARIKEAIAAYGLTAEDLGLAGRPRGARRAAPAPAPKAAPRAGTVGVPKYRDPQTGRTWTGRGKPPTWIAGVADRTPFLIEGAGEGGDKKPARSRRAAPRRDPGSRRGGRKAEKAPVPEVTPTE